MAAYVREVNVEARTLITTTDDAVFGCLIEPEAVAQLFNESAEPLVCVELAEDEGPVWIGRRQVVSIQAA